MQSLFSREIHLGGYDLISTSFQSRDSSKSRTVLVYVATERSRHYLGDCDLDTMSSQIIEARGPSGSNIEYVLKLAEYCRNNIPEDTDNHLFELEGRLKAFLKSNRVSSESSDLSSEDNTDSECSDCDSDDTTSATYSSDSEGV